jgi:hypothetical protein
MLHANTRKFTPVLNLATVFLRKYVYHIRHFSAPSGCSTVDRRTRIRFGSRASHSSTASSTCSCPQRDTRRYGLVVYCSRIEQLGRFYDQYLWIAWAFSSAVKRQISRSPAGYSFSSSSV